MIEKESIAQFDGTLDQTMLALGPIFESIHTLKASDLKHESTIMPLEWVSGTWQRGRTPQTCLSRMSFFIHIPREIKKILFIFIFIFIFIFKTKGMKLDGHSKFLKMLLYFNFKNLIFKVTGLLA